MIQSRLELKNVLTIEFYNYFKNRKDYYYSFLRANNRYKIWKYQKALRRMEFYYNVRDIYRAKIIKYCYLTLMFCYYSRKVNLIGSNLGIDTWHNVFDSGLHIYHSAGGVVVNSKTKVGKNCRLHGNNCIGNDGKSQECPIIGDGCTLGVGAKVIGNIRLGNNIVIGAGAVVINDCLEDGVLLIGIPATIHNPSYKK